MFLVYLISGILFYVFRQVFFVILKSDNYCSALYILLEVNYIIIKLYFAYFVVFFDLIKIILKSFGCSI